MFAGLWRLSRTGLSYLKRAARVVEFRRNEGALWVICKDQKMQINSTMKGVCKKRAARGSNDRLRPTTCLRVKPRWAFDV